MSNGKKLPKKSSESTAEMFTPREAQTPSTSGNATTPASGEPQQSREVIPAKNWFEALKNKGEMNKNQLVAVLPKGVSAERFLTTATLYLRNRPELWGLEVGSVFSAFLQAAQQGLDFGLPNEAHIVPFKGKASMIRGYKGDMKCVRRNPNIRFFDANAVCENDEFEVDLAGEKIVHKLPRLGSKPRGSIQGFYAIAKDVDGNQYVLVLDNDQVWDHAKRFTKAFNKGPFADVVAKGPNSVNWEPYGLKTAVHLICGRKLDMHTDMAPQLEEERKALMQDDLAQDFTLDLPSEEELKAEIQEGVADLDAGRTVVLDGDAIKEKGREMLDAKAEEKQSPVEGQQGWTPTEEEAAEIAKQEAAEAAANG